MPQTPKVSAKSHHNPHYSARSDQTTACTDAPPLLDPAVTVLSGRCTAASLIQHATFAAASVQRRPKVT